MKRWIVVVLALAAAGCSAEFPLKWKPTELQKQGLDLVDQGLDALEEDVPSEKRMVWSQAKTGVRITKRYIGEPESRPALLDETVMPGAAGDASRAQPRVIEIIGAGVDELDRQLDPWLALAASIAGIWGAREVGGQVRKYRRKYKRTVEAMRETVGAIDEASAGLSPQAQSMLKSRLREHQSEESRACVAELRG